MNEQAFAQKPDEECLNIESAILDSSNRLESSAYITLKTHFASEAPKELHPIPSNPGTTADEQENLQYLSWWSDARGAGWKVSMNKGQTKYFSFGKWNSWRLAFLLARLQRDVWVKKAECRLDKNALQIIVHPCSSLVKRKNRQQRLPKDKKTPADVDKLQTPSGCERPNVSEHWLWTSPVANRKDNESQGTKHHSLTADEASLSGETGTSCCIAQIARSAATDAAMTPIVTVEQRQPLNEILSNHNAKSYCSRDKAKRQLSDNSRETYRKLCERRQDIPAESRSNVAFTYFLEESDEPRMTVKGAILVVNSGGKLDVNGYMILKHLFADTVPREQHPVPSKPGVKEDEQEQTENLRWWSDAKGEGWIAKGPNMGTRTKDKWFNAHKCGSWRLAFLLAKLQRDIWLSGVHIKWAIDNA